MTRVLSLLFFSSLISTSAAAHTCLDIFAQRSFDADPYASIIAGFGLRETFGENGLEGLLELAKAQNFAPPAIEDFQRHQGLPRHEKLLKNAKSAIESRSETQFVVIFEGFRHTLELYRELGGRSDTIYLGPDPNAVGAYPLFEAVVQRAQGLNAEAAQQLKVEILNEIQKAHGTLNRDWFEYVVDTALAGQRDRFENQIGYILQSLAILTAVYKTEWKPKLSVPVQRQKARVAVLGDIHFIPSTDHLKKLPTAAELKAQGLTEVILRIEGVPAGTESSVEALSGSSSVAGVVTDPVLEGLRIYLHDQYIKNDIRVRVMGLE